MAVQLPDCKLSIPVQTDENHTDLHMRKKPTADSKSLFINTLSSLTSGHALNCLQHLHSYIPAVHTPTAARPLQQSIFALYIKLNAGLQLKADRATAPQVNTTFLSQEQNLPVC